MARRAQPRRPPGVILNPDVDGDDDDEIPCNPIPDANGWVILKRSDSEAKDGEEERRPAGDGE